MKRCIAAVLAVLSLSGCADETANLGAPPPILLGTFQTVVVAPSRSAGLSRTQLNDAIVSIAQGQPQSVRAEIHMRSPRASESVRRELIGLGLDPARLSVLPLRADDPRPPAVVFRRKVAETIPCAAAIEPGLYDDPSPSLLSLARCQQNNNLAQMLVDPTDLVAPPRLAQQDGAYLANGVQAWRTPRAAPQPARGTASGNYDLGLGVTTPVAVPIAAPPAAPPAAQ